MASSSRRPAGSAPRACWRSLTPRAASPSGCPTASPCPARGTLLEVRGAIADPYGQLELRPSASGITVVGTGALPSPMTIAAGQAGEPTEGRLATIRGTVAAAPTKATSGDITLTITGSDGATLRLLADASATLDVSILRKGTVATFTGIVGQRASRKGVLDGYRLWVRDRADIASVTPARTGVIRDRRSRPGPRPAGVHVGRVGRDGEGARRPDRHDRGRADDEPHAARCERPAGDRRGPERRHRGLPARGRWPAEARDAGPADRHRGQGLGCAAAQGDRRAGPGIRQPSPDDASRDADRGGRMAARPGHRHDRERQEERRPLDGGARALGVDPHRPRRPRGERHPEHRADRWTERDGHRHRQAPLSDGDGSPVRDRPAADTGRRTRRGGERRRCRVAGRVGGARAAARRRRTAARRPQLPRRPTSTCGISPPTSGRGYGSAGSSRRWRRTGSAWTTGRRSAGSSSRTPPRRCSRCSSRATPSTRPGPPSSVTSSCWSSAMRRTWSSWAISAPRPRPTPRTPSTWPAPIRIATARAASLGRGMGVDPASAGVGTLALVTALSIAVTLARRHRAQRVLRQRIVARLEAIGRGERGRRRGAGEPHPGPGHGDRRG